MKVQDARKKSDTDLQKLLSEIRENARSLRFKIVSKEVKNHQQLKFLKKDIARILTILRERHAAK